MNGIIPSPCIRKCCLGKNDICLGCFRSLEEICNWTQVDEQTRQQFVLNARIRNKNKEKTHQVSKT